MVKAKLNSAKIESECRCRVSNTCRLRCSSSLSIILTGSSNLKYDGFRADTYIQCGSVSLVSRKGNAYKSFPKLSRDIGACIQVLDAVLDGEIVHLDSDGRPQFYPLLRRRAPQQFVRSICCRSTATIFDGSL